MRFLTGYPCEFVRFGEERWVHFVNLLETNLSQTGWKDDEMQTEIGTAQTIINDIKDLDWVVDGVSFMKAAITHLGQQRKETAVQGGRFTSEQGKHTYVKFRWEWEGLIIDNTNVCYCKNDTPAIVIYTKVALKMGWLRKISSGLILGPNLQQEFMGDQIPDMKNDWNDVNDDQSNRSFGRFVLFYLIIYHVLYNRSILPDYLQFTYSYSIYN